MEFAIRYSEMLYFTQQEDEACQIPLHCAIWSLCSSILRKSKFRLCKRKENTDGKLGSVEGNS